MDVNTLATLLITSVTFGLGQSYVLSVVDYNVNKSNAENLPWTVMMVTELSDPIQLHIEEIHYGSLIHRQAVLVTSTFKLQTRDMPHIIGGCQNFEIDIYNHTLAYNCQRRKVSKVFEEELKDYFKDPSTKVYYSLLILNKPFKLNEKVNVISLENGRGHLEGDCFISVLKNLYSRKNNQKVTTISSYELQMDSEHERIYLSEDGKFMDKEMRTEVFDVQGSDKILIEILGSPVVCPQYYEPGKYSQIGFFDAKMKFDSRGDVQRVFESFVDLTRFSTSIYKWLNDHFKSVHVKSSDENEKNKKNASSMKVVNLKKNDISDTECPISCRCHEPKTVNITVTVKINGIVTKSDNIIRKL